LSYVLALLGFIVLVILHELGHFAAAKAVGMRVERFSLFFPPHILKKQVGETEYALGVIPAGGYVKITGMNPDEKLPDEVRTRAYYSQPRWKRVVVIAAVLAFVLLWVFAIAQGPEHPTRRVDSVAKTLPAAHVLRPGDVVVAVDGHAGGPGRIHDLLAKHRCPVQPPRSGCRAAVPATVVVRRGAHRLVLRLTPVYDRATKTRRIGFTYGFANDPEAPGAAVKTAANQFWFFSRKTVALPLRVFNAKKRKEIGSAVGAYEVTRETIETSAIQAVGIIALISLSLAIVNLYPFLPLDGGHIFWAIVEKVRRKPVPFSTMERSGVVGFVLVLMLFAIGLTNDIHTLSNGGFKAP
jgi:regulator of sigma E protease